MLLLSITTIVFGIATVILAFLFYWTHKMKIDYRDKANYWHQQHIELSVLQNYTSRNELYFKKEAEKWRSMYYESENKQT